MENRKIRPILKTCIASFKIAIFVTYICFLFGCQGSIASQLIANSYPTAPRNYKTAGFENAEEVSNYARNYQYLAFKISQEDWRAFYMKFPEYWIDIQNSKSNTFMNDYNSGYTAYAFKWNLLKKKEAWDNDTLKRLDDKKVVSGDDVFKVIYAIGVPERIIWDNDFEILIYNDDKCILIQNNKCSSILACKGCVKKMSAEEIRARHLPPNGDSYTISNAEILTLLRQKRPIY